MTTAPNDNVTLTELLDSALNILEEGFAVLDQEARVVAWNPAATAATGFRRAEMLGRPLPDAFYEIDPHAAHAQEGAGFRIDRPERPIPVNLRHHQGHTLPAMLRLTPLRDALGHRCGTVLRFHPSAEMDALPHGETCADADLDEHVDHNVCNLEERLQQAWQEWSDTGAPFGLLWVLVDQAEMLLKTHGRDASEAMLAIVERALSHALHPTEILGRWGHHEFLVLCHERNAELLLLHGRHLCDLTHSADFRWWGDRVPLTISVGCAQAAAEVKLRALMQHARQAMERARLAGGNTALLEAGEITRTPDGR